MQPAQGAYPRACAGLGAAPAAFLAGSAVALAAMIVIVQAPASRSLQTLAIVLGVALASAGLVGVVSRSRSLPRGAGEVIDVPARALAPGLLTALLSVVALRFVVHAAGRGALSAGVVAPLVTALCLVALAGAWRCAERLRAPSDVSPPARQPLWLAALSLLLYLPALGGFGLIDPWEPQYSEVAREMLARRDWSSLWWGDRRPAGAAARGGRDPRRGRRRLVDARPRHQPLLVLSGAADDGRHVLRRAAHRGARLPAAGHRGGARGVHSRAASARRPPGALRIRLAPRVLCAERARARAGVLPALAARELRRSRAAPARRRRLGRVPRQLRPARQRPV